MEMLHKKYNDLMQIHAAFGVSIKRYKKAAETHEDLETQKVRRDSTIKRFDLTYVLLWKYLQKYFTITQDIMLDSPRKLFQQCLASNITNAQETEQLLQLIKLKKFVTRLLRSEIPPEIWIELIQNRLKTKKKNFSFTTVIIIIITPIRGFDLGHRLRFLATSNGRCPAARHSSTRCRSL